MLDQQMSSRSNDSSGPPTSFNIQRRLLVINEVKNKLKRRENQSKSSNMDDIIKDKMKNQFKNIMAHNKMIE